MHIRFADRHRKAEEPLLREPTNAEEWSAALIRQRPGSYAIRLVVIQSLRQIANGRDRLRSARDPAQFGDKGGCSPHVSYANLGYLFLFSHRHCFVACRCSSCLVETAEAEPWSGYAFQAPDNFSDTEAPAPCTTA